MGMGGLWEFVPKFFASFQHIHLIIHAAQKANHRHYLSIQGAEHNPLIQVLQDLCRFFSLLTSSLRVSIHNELHKSLRHQVHGRGFSWPVCYSGEWKPANSLKQFLAPVQWSHQVQHTSFQVWHMVSARYFTCHSMLAFKNVSATIVKSKNDLQIRHLFVSCPDIIIDRHTPRRPLQVSKGRF